MPSVAPAIVVLAGPNGAGKTTAARTLIRDTVGVAEFVNADTIATGLTAFAPDQSSFEAGRIMIKRIRQLAQERASFAFETTLASRTFAPWITECKRSGYEIHLAFLWLPSPDLAVRRVAERVKTGGHDVPEETIRRRYRRGLTNLGTLYIPLATSWRIYDNSLSSPQLVASRQGLMETETAQPELWDIISRSFHNG